MARQQLESEVRALCDRGEHRAAVTLAIRDYGPEVLGFLVVLARDPADAGDVFADLCVRMWKSLPGFRWQCSLRTWIYVLARRAFAAHRRERLAWRERHVPIPDAPELDELVAKIRTTTLARVREEQSTRAHRLRAQLAPDEQALLTLRVDRDLEWREIARVLAEQEHEDEVLDDTAATREAAALRKRFERLKDRLRQLAAEDPEA